MSIPLNLYQCHQCGEQWSAQGPSLQSDGCVNCGLTHVSPVDDARVDDPDIVEFEQFNGRQNVNAGGFDFEIGDDEFQEIF